MRPKDQGTRWETEFVNRAINSGLVAGRHAEAGNNDLGDVWIGTPTVERDDIVAVAWLRLTGDGARRSPDGERDVIVIRTDDFLRLARLARAVVHVECKARQALNVTRTLYRARGKIAKAITRREHE